ncbi:unnamed protein product [Bemisia tabaci]|uniref:General transcription factor 3C polypeptide 3 n=1 Tax=Bemisia tabaci TaxID=7038 RepID=A0A9P0EYA7_BEMTA|nr:PREDICTED: general transcription factor 3C polypeptide 3 [Bemisia tabaci]CAH0380896.1 unnamed protein product [Bemisia tabaci]
MDEVSEAENLLDQPSASHGSAGNASTSYPLSSGSQDANILSSALTAPHVIFLKREVEDPEDSCDEGSDFSPLQDPPEDTSLPDDPPQEVTLPPSGELIDRFLKGDIDFAQYAEQMGDGDLEGGEDDEALVSEVATNLNIKTVSKPTSDGSPAKKRISRSKRDRVPKKLPPALVGLMGEANVCYARGDISAATEMCLEVIRLHPQASEPFFTLSHIYEDSGNSDKAMQMSLIGAHLNPSNTEIWLQLAEKSEKAGNIKQAATCYTQALKKDPSLDLLAKRADLQLRLGDKKNYFRSLVKMVDIARKSNQYEQDLEISKKLAEYYFREENDYESAKNALESAIINCSNIVKFEHINLYLELLILTKDFIKCLEVMVEHCGLEFVADVDEENNSFSVVSLSIPTGMMVDFLAKLVIVLILMKSNHLFDQIFSCILKFDPNKDGDLYLDVAETLINENLHSEALTFLNPLTESKNYSLPAVWIRKAECLTAVEKYREAIQAYEIVLEKVPLHNDARLALADLLTKVGEKEYALKVLSFSNYETGVDLKLVYEKCMLIKGDENKEDEFVNLAELILYRHLGKIRNLDEKGALAHLRSAKNRIEAITKIRKLRNEVIDDDDGPVFHETDETPTIQQEYELFLDLCNLFIRRKKYHKLQRLTFSALTSRKFGSITDLNFFAFISCFFCQDGSAGFDFGRALLTETNFENTRAWNLMAILFDYIDHQRVYKYLTRLTSRLQSNYYIIHLKANCCLISHIAHKFALNDFALLYQKHPENAFLAFLTALCFIQLVCQKYSSKHLLFSQGIAFFSKYIENRGDDCAQEIHYNMGRAFHQVSLLHHAAYHYNIALKSKPVIDSEMFDLKREIAYNLHLIYMESGEIDIATSLLEEYVII